MRHIVRDGVAQRGRVNDLDLPALLTTSEVAELLRTTRKAIYAMVERGQLPGVVRLGRRLLLRKDARLDFLSQKSEPSLER